MTRWTSIPILAALAVCGCNTFADPDPEQAESTDVGHVDGGNDASIADIAIADADKMRPDQGMSNDIGVDADPSSDVGPDISLGPPDYVPTRSGLPAVSTNDFASTMFVCGDTIDLGETARTRTEAEITTVVVSQGTDERTALTWVNPQGLLQVGYLEGSSFVPLFTSEFSVRSRGIGKVISVATIGATWLVGVIDAQDRVNLVQCTLSGSPACRSVNTNEMATNLELGRDGDTYFLYLPSTVGVAEITVTPTPFGIGNRTEIPFSGPVDLIHRGVFQFTLPVLGVQSGTTGPRFEFATRANNQWGASLPTLATSGAAYPRIDFLPHLSAAWVLTSDFTDAYQVEELSYDGMSWSSGEVVQTEVRDYGLQTVAGGFVRVIARADGRVSLDLDTNSAKATVMTIRNEGAGLVVAPPVRIGMTNGQPGLLATHSGTLTFLPLCKTPP